MKDGCMNAAIKLAAALAVPVLGLALTAAPAQAASDTNLSGFGPAGIGSVASGAAPGAQGSNSGLKTIGNQKVSPAADTSNDAMPDNPSQKLPDKVSAAVPDDATVVSKDLAVTKDGQIKNLETGKPVTDPKLVGTPDKPADPLAKTDGKRFIPVEASEVKQAVQQNGGDANAADSANNGSSSTGAGASASSSPSNIPGNGNASSEASTSGDSSSATGNNASAVSRHSEPKANDTAYVGTAKAPNSSVRNAALQNNQYGAYWGSYNGTQAFFKGNKQLFAQQAKGVVDVSEHQGTINWQAAKNAGVEGAIIRIGYGWGNGYDIQARRNISECKRLGIPFGIYLYSYADSVAASQAEGKNVGYLLTQAGVRPGDLSYPVYYDLEQWTWAGHTPPTDPWIYDNMVNNFFAYLENWGYHSISVYSYAGYLETALNTPNIHGRTNWVASYGSRPGVYNSKTGRWNEFQYAYNFRGWQYADNGNIAGIGNVDMNAFGNYSFENSVAIMYVKREEDIAVCGVLRHPDSNVEYEWLSYDVNRGVWKPISWWSKGNCASWKENKGAYWLHLEARNSQTHRTIGTQTSSMSYSTNAAINGMYVGQRSNGVLLGMSSNDSQGKYVIKLYDTNSRRWFTQFTGPWATWRYPYRGMFWAQFELYTSDGRLMDARTYLFGI